MSSTNRIHSFVRCRPCNAREIAAGEHVSPPLVCSATDVTVNSAATGRGTQFVPDVVFDKSATQEDVWRAVAMDMEDDVLEGYNCVLFAYGQTGTGKTHTMEGDISSDGPALSQGAGIVPRTACSIFAKLEARKEAETRVGGASAFEYVVKVSAVELYNEEFKDCLRGYEFGAGKKCHAEQTLKKAVEKAQRMSADATMAMKEATAGSRGKKMRTPSIHVKLNAENALVNAQEVPCNSHARIIDLLKYAQLQRATAATNMNATSSRSHFVLQIVVQMTVREIGATSAETRIKRGKLFLVDLAGSECAARSGVVGKGKREMKNINRSNEALKRVIATLANRAGSHVPYRDSKLTRILQPALGGSAKTRIIGTVSPTLSGISESASTLRYVCMAKQIKNCPIKCQEVSKEGVNAAMNTQLVEMRKMLTDQYKKDGVHITTERYTEMQASVEALKTLELQYNTVTGQKDAEIAAKAAEMEQLNASIAELHNENALKVEQLAAKEGELATKTVEWKASVIDGHEQRVAVGVHARIGRLQVERGRSVRKELLKRNHTLNEQAEKTERMRTLNASNTSAAATFATETSSTFLGLSQLTSQFFKENDAAIAAAKEKLDASKSSTTAFGMQHREWAEAHCTALSAAFGTGVTISNDATATTATKRAEIGEAHAAFTTTRSDAIQSMQDEMASFKMEMVDSALPALAAQIEETYSAACAYAATETAAVEADRENLATHFNTVQNRCNSFVEEQCAALSAERSALAESLEKERELAAEEVGSVANTTIVAPLDAVREMIATNATAEANAMAALRAEFAQSIAVEKAHAANAAATMAETFKKLLLAHAETQAKRFDELASNMVADPLTERSSAVAEHNETLTSQIAQIAASAEEEFSKTATTRSTRLSTLVEETVTSKNTEHAMKLESHRMAMIEDSSAALAVLVSIAAATTERCVALERSAEEEKASFERASASMRTFVENTTAKSGGFLMGFETDAAAYENSLTLAIDDVVESARSQFSRVVSTLESAKTKAHASVAAIAESCSTAVASYESTCDEAGNNFVEVGALANAFGEKTLAECSGFNDLAQELASEQIRPETHTGDTPSKSFVETAISVETAPFASPVRSEAIVEKASAALKSLDMGVEATFTPTVAINTVLKTMGMACVTPTAVGVRDLDADIQGELGFIQDQIASLPECSPPAVPDAAVQDDAATAFAATAPPLPPTDPVALEKVVLEEDAVSEVVAQEEVVPAARNAGKRGKPVPRVRRKSKKALSRGSTPSKKAASKTPGKGKGTRRSMRLKSSTSMGDVTNSPAPKAKRLR
tara:strand:+ start:469 stop:4407 length:3939 start_codon:yes stop_codon:yes gene_type:complete